MRRSKRPITIIRRSCSDSPLPASQMDRVFGSDKTGNIDVGDHESRGVIPENSIRADSYDEVESGMPSRTSTCRDARTMGHQRAMMLYTRIGGDLSKIPPQSSHGVRYFPFTERRRPRLTRKGAHPGRFERGGRTVTAPACAQLDGSMRHAFGATHPPEIR
jgi:hypothetical protein